jgi:hypothetical protein
MENLELWQQILAGIGFIAVIALGAYIQELAKRNKYKD